MKKFNIAFAGGGTGGHVTPISSLIEYAHTQSDIMGQIGGLFWFGSRGQLEETFAYNFPDVHFVPIKSGKMRRYWTVRSTLKNLRDVAYFNAGYIQSLYLLKQHKIDVLFCKGGYVALPVSFAAATLRIPIIVHESDSHPGLVNKLVSKFAKKNFDGFPSVLKNSSHVGQILSPNLMKNNGDVDFFTLDKNKKTLLVICGSQGSKAVFEEIKKQLDRGGQIVKELNIVIILGLLNKKYKKTFDPYIQVTTFDFLDSNQLGELYRITDVAITRGSATTLAELEMFGIPKVIVPLSSHDQPLNAAWYRANKGDIVVAQNNISEILSGVQHHLEHLKKKNLRDNDTLLLESHKAIWGTLIEKS